MVINRRASKRQATMGLLSSMWDGKSVCIGVVEDVSATGILVSQIPSHFDENSQECLSVVHAPGQDFKIILQPSWKVETKKEMYQQVGFKVVQPATKWEQFVARTLETTGLFSNSFSLKKVPKITAWRKSGFGR